MTQRRATAQARKYAPTTYPFGSVVPQANQAMRSVRVKAIAVQTAMKPSAGRGAKPKRRPCRSSFTGGAMLAALRILRRFRHSATRRAIVATRRFSSNPADRCILTEDGDPLERLYASATDRANELHHKWAKPYIKWVLPDEQPKDLELGPVEETGRG